MAFTYNRTDLINNRSYNEIELGRALNNGLINFCASGFRFENGLITSGVGINNGFPFELGKINESVMVENGYTGFAIIKSTIGSLNSVTELIFNDDKLDKNESTNSTKYFTIFEFENGLVKQDFSRINYLDSVKFIDNGDETFSIVINGFKSEPFAKYFVAGDDLFYDKLESDSLFVHKTSDENVDGEKTFSEKIVSLKQIIGLWLNPQADAISSNYITFQKTNGTPRVSDNHELLTGRYEKKSYANGVENSNMVMTSVGIYHGNSISANTKLSKDLSNIDRTGMNVGLNSAFTIPGLTQHPFLAGYDHMQIVLSNNDLLTVNLSRDLSIIYLSNTIAFASGANGANMYAYALTHSGTNTFTLTRAYAKSISETTISNLTPPNIASARLVRTGGQ